MRAYGYIRVSKEREGMISPGIQRDEITRYAERQGWTVARWFEDLDLKGWQFEERPGLQEMLADVRSGECEAVVVYRLDRFSREPRHYYQMIYELDACGVPLHDSSEGRYMPGPELNLVRGIKILLAKNETAVHSQRLKDSHKRLRATGRFAGGHAPYGMRHTDPPPGLEPDPVEAPWAVQMHEWFQRGWTVNRIARELNAQDAPTRTGAKWLASTVLRDLRRPTLAGGRLDAGQLVTGGNITPLITEECWRRTQALMSGNYERFRAGKTSRGPIPTKLVRCGTCGHGLQVHHRNVERVISLRCSASRDGACKRGVAIYAHVLEREVQARLVARLSRAKAAPPAKSMAATTDISRRDHEVEAVQNSLERLALAYAEGAMEMTEYQAARTKLVTKLEKAQALRSKAEDQVESCVLSEAIRALWADLGVLGKHPELIAAMPEQQRRDLYQLLIEKVVVYPAGCRPRVEVVFRF